MKQTKTCSKCRKRKSASSFNPRRDSHDGLRNQCKACTIGQVGSGTPGMGGGRLPIEPFRAWLEERLEHYDNCIEDLSRAIDVDSRQLRRLLRESTWVALDTVDRAVLTEGSTSLWALGYSEKDFQDAARGRKKRRKSKA